MAFCPGCRIRCRDRRAASIRIEPWSGAVGHAAAKSPVIKISVVSCDDLCVDKCVATHMPENFAQRLNAPELGPCACSQVRRTARAISSFYDAALSASDLTITPYAILTKIARAGRLKLTVLAAKLE